MLILFTDFGINSPYVGQMKLAAWRYAPQLPAVDLCHDLAPFDSRGAAYLLAALATDLPTDCAVVGVVDPGVGGDRAGLIVQADRRFFVGPDNGLFDRVMARAGAVKTWRIGWRPPRLSATFHGRDLFTPVAAMLLSGQKEPDQLGEPVESRCFYPDANLARIIFIDGYGNAMTGIAADAVATTTKLAVDGQPLPRAKTFSDVETGQGFCYENSLGLLEIAVNQGNAERQFGLRVGDSVEIVH